MSDFSLSKDLAAITYVGDLIPTSGRGTPIAPPTYISPQKNGPAEFARAEKHPVPVSAAESDYFEFAKDPKTGALILSPAVVVNSLGAEATRIESAIIENEKLLGVKLPGIFLDHKKSSDKLLLDIADKTIKNTKGKTQYTAELLAATLRDDLVQANSSTWTTAHRHADTYIRHSVIDGKQIWSDPASDVYKIIASASANRADLLFRYFPNSALLGFWLSSVAPRRHKLARSLSSIITGYDAHDVTYGATKGDVLGGITNLALLTRNPATLELQEGKSTNDHKPSAVGLGQVPNTPTTKAFTCGSILRQSSISMTNLRHLVIPNDKNASYLVADVLAWLGIFGLLITEHEGFLRSGCDLVTARATSGFTRVNKDGTREKWNIDVNDAIAGFKAAYDKLPEELHFADRIYTEYPEAILSARAKTLIKESTSKGEDA